MHAHATHKHTCMHMHTHACTCTHCTHECTHNVTRHKDGAHYEAVPVKLAATPLLPSHRHAHSYNGGFGVAALNEVHHLPHIPCPCDSVQLHTLGANKERGERREDWKGEGRE